MCEKKQYGALSDAHSKLNKDYIMYLNKKTEKFS